jgi:hypothetical protein
MSGAASDAQATALVTEWLGNKAGGSLRTPPPHCAASGLTASFSTPHPSPLTLKLTLTLPSRNRSMHTGQVLHRDGDRR